MTRGRIVEVRITPLAFEDPPLLNAEGVHEPHVLRALVELDVETGRGSIATGIGECVGHAWQLDWLELVAPRIVGLSAFDAAALDRVVSTTLAGDGVDLAPDAAWRRWSDRDPSQTRGPAPIPAADFDRRRVSAALEVASLDAIGRVLDVPVVDLLGGARRPSVDYAGYLFFKLASHPGAEPDPWGEAMDADGIVRQAERMIALHGFRSLKLKGGVLAPDVEVEAIEALARRFPGMPLRLDPNTAWTLATTLRVLPRLEQHLEYLEDPVRGLVDMAHVARRTSLPLATNMCVTSLEHVADAVRLGSVDIVLADHHYWDGLRGTTRLGDVTRAAGFGLSMHSNSHLGISLAAMTHAAAATPMHHACDTHHPWNAHEDVVDPDAIGIVDGRVAVPRGPGLGVEVDRERVRRLHERYLALGREHRMDQRYATRLGLTTVTGPMPRW